VSHFKPAVSKPNGLLSNKLCHYLNHNEGHISVLGRTLNGLL